MKRRGRREAKRGRASRKFLFFLATREESERGGGKDSKKGKGKKRGEERFPLRRKYTSDLTSQVSEGGGEGKGKKRKGRREGKERKGGEKKKDRTEVQSAVRHRRNRMKKGGLFCFGGKKGEGSMKRTINFLFLTFQNAPFFSWKRGKRSNRTDPYGFL